MTRHIFFLPSLSGLFALALTVMVLPGAAKAADAWPENCKLQLAASLPFTMQNGHVRITASVNDVPRHFIIDTGGLLSSVTQKVAEEQKLKTLPIDEDIKIRGLGGGRIKRYAVADTLTFAHLKANNVHLLMMVDRGDGEDGLIAPDYLRNFDLEFDFAARTLNLFHPHRCADHAVYWSSPYVVLPLDINDQGHIQVPVTLDGQEMRAFLDTGAPGTLIGARTAAAKFQIAPSGMGSIGLGGASGGTTGAARQQFRTPQLGGLTINNPPLLVTENETSWRSEHADILLGLNELSRLHLYIAYREKKLYLSPGPAAEAAP